MNFIPRIRRAEQERRSEEQRSRYAIRNRNLLNRIRSELDLKDYRKFVEVNTRFHNKEFNTDQAFIKILIILQHKIPLCHAMIGIMPKTYKIRVRAKDHRILYTSPTMKNYLISQFDDGSDNTVSSTTSD